MGIEPWHVLGEEMSSTGTARFVDSSLERVQVKLKGMNESPLYIIMQWNRVPLKRNRNKRRICLRYPLPCLAATSALHPTIGVDTPLTFDIVDTWNSRSIGGCTYYVSHPGGRSYDTFPINGYEAESRRVSRFGDTSHTQDVLRPAPYFALLPIISNRTVYLFYVIRLQ